MNESEAGNYLAEYRALLKKWTMCVAGIGPGNPDALAGMLNEREAKLNEVAEAFPDKAYSVDLLVNARRRTWAGYEDERVPRAQQA